MTSTMPAPLTGTPPSCDRQWLESVCRHVVASPRSATYDVVAPFTGQPCATLPLSTDDDVKHAYRAARTVQPAWAALPIARRATIVRAFHQLVLRHQHTLLDLIQIETGKARLHAFEEVAYIAQVARHYANAGERYLRPRRTGGLLPITRVECRHQPLGVVGVVTPWNYPLAVGFIDVLCALLAGNSVVHRPDPQASLTALFARDLLHQAGLPHRVLQTVLGDGPTVGATVLDHADHVCYVGSSAVGREVALRAADRLIGYSLELGGKNPMYVAGDANIEAAAEGAIRSCFTSAGQICVGTERIYVHDVVFDDFLAAFLRRIERLRIGPALAYNVDMGSLGSQRHFDRVHEHLNDALTQGATLLTGGTALSHLGPWFFAPTVLSDVTPSMLIHSQETFGPVVWVQRVHSDAEAIRAANDSSQGLIASVWSTDHARARAIAAHLRCGSVTINEGYAASTGAISAPMGGMKTSGQGRRHGAEGLLRFTEPQSIATQHVRGHGVPPGFSEETFAKAVTGYLRIKHALRLR